MRHVLHWIPLSLNARGRYLKICRSNNFVLAFGSTDTSDMAVTFVNESLVANLELEVVRDFVLRAQDKAFIWNQGSA